MRILLIEDEMLIAREQQLYLEDAGHEVAGPATDADQAVAFSSAGTYDLALVDVHLARGTSGIDAARHLSGIGIPCLFVTSHPEGVVAERLGMGCLLKPFGAADLVAAVNVAGARLRGEPLPALPRNLILFDDPPSA